MEERERVDIRENTPIAKREERGREERVPISEGRVWYRYRSDIASGYVHPLSF